MKKVYLLVLSISAMFTAYGQEEAAQEQVTEVSDSVKLSKEWLKEEAVITKTEEGNELTINIEDEMLLELDLDFLLNMEVTVASKVPERISDAPGMITAYSKDDIEDYGYYTIKDLANITSGYSTFSAFGETNMETRGQKAGSWNVSKHLLLVDGIPMNHSRANSAPLEYQIPVFFAEKVEFLKGPGSALYGTSAFYGVVSVTPKSLKENGTLVESKTSFGDLGNSKRMMANALVKTDVGQLGVSFSLYKKAFSGDSLGANNNNNFHFNNDNSVFMNTSYKFTSTKLKGLGIGMIYMRRNSHAGEFWGATVSPANEVTWEEVIPYVKYQRDLSDKLSFNSYLNYDASQEKSTFGASWASFGLNSAAFAGYDYTTTNIEALTELNYEIDESSSFIGGLNFDSRQEVDSPTSFNWNIASAQDTSVSKNYTFNHSTHQGTIRVNVASAYTQYRKELRILNGMILTAGARFDYGFSEAAVYSQLSPRVAVVQRLTDKLNVKVMYGQALRVPGVKELGLNDETKDAITDNGGTGNTGDIPDPGAEVIKSFEAGVNYNSNKFSAALAVFSNTTTDALDGTQYSYVDKNGASISANYFSNTAGKINANGFELDLKYAVSRNFKMMLNHSYAKAVINDSIDFIDVPTQKTNAAVSYTLPASFKLTSTVVVRHMWGMTVSDGAYDENLVDHNSSTEVAGFSMVDLNFRLPIIDQFGVELQVRNVFDTEWRQPALLGQNYMIPLQGRNFLATVYAKF